MHAQYLLGWMLRDGAGMPRSPGEARTWLTKAARKGNGAAALLLGDMALNGEVAQKDTSAAIVWFEKAAAAGNRAALSRLYLLHSKGIDGTVPLPAPAPRQRSAIDDGYRRLQLEFAAGQSATDQESALVATRRLLELDPADADARNLAERLWSSGGSKLAALFMNAEQHVTAGEFQPLTLELNEIISLHPDESRLRELITRYWLRSDELFRKAERDATEILQSLEGFDTPESIRRNQTRIQKLTAAFTELIDKMGRERPGDQRLTALVQRFERLKAALARKREDRREERKEEPVDTADAVFKKGVSLLENGQFDAAAKLFEKLARTPGYNNVAGAYIHLGIASLARINVSKVKEAKKLRLKGISSFQNALRFDRKATLPDSYVQYKDIFEEARSLLKQERI